MADKKNTILVVDDEPHIHKMLGILLDVENFRIAESTSGSRPYPCAPPYSPT
jgi:DNA-binding response OmpR family regulator